MTSGKIIAVGIGILIIVIIFGALYGLYFSGFNSAQSKDENVKSLLLTLMHSYKEDMILFQI